MQQNRLIFGLTATAVLLGSLSAWTAWASSSSAGSADTAAEKQLSPEETMKSRYPQPVRVGALVGLRVNDWNDSIIGYVARVIRTADGKIQLVVPYNAWFGWIQNGGIMDGHRRAVAMPLEAVAIRGRQIDALEMLRADFDAAPTVADGESNAIPADDEILIAITRR